MVSWLKEDKLLFENLFINVREVVKRNECQSAPIADYIVHIMFGPCFGTPPPPNSKG
jgi:hypothetical protein